MSCWLSVSWPVSSRLAGQQDRCYRSAPIRVVILGPGGSISPPQDRFDIAEDLQWRTIGRNRVVVPSGIMIHDRRCHLLVGLQSGSDDFYTVIGATNQFRAVDIADTRLDRRLEEQIVDAAALRALPTGRNSLDQNGLGGREMEYRRRRKSHVLQFAVEVNGLWHGSGIAVE